MIQVKVWARRTLKSLACKGGEHTPRRQAQCTPKSLACKEGEQYADSNENDSNDSAWKNKTKEK